MAEPTMQQLNARLTRLENEAKQMQETQEAHGEKLAEVHDAIVGTTKEKGMRDKVDRLVEAWEEGKGFKRAAALLVLGALVGFIFTALGAAIGFTPGRAKAAELMAPALAYLSAPAHAHAINGNVAVDQGGEAPEPDPGQVWPPDPDLARAVWVQPEGAALHASAGSRTQAHPQYHLTAVGDARRIVRSLPDTTPGAHVFGANSGTVGLALACGAGSIYSAAPAFDLVGGVQPIPQQVEDLAAVAAEVAIKWRLDLGGTRRLASGARVPVLATHRDYAIAGGYAAARFDPGGKLAQAIRAKARWYFTTTKAGKRQAVWVK